MSNVKSYFVSVKKQKITDASIPDMDEYEIKATEDDVEELENLFNEKDGEEKDAAKFLAKPFNEWGADEAREAYDSTLMRIYKRIYELGTSETRQKLDTMELD